jgi:hypothetical protein
MVPLHDDLDARFHLRQDGIRITREIGVADVKRSHIHDDTALEGASRRELKMVGPCRLELQTSTVSR